MKIINISYRLPVSFEERDNTVEVKQSSGGLVSAVQSLKTDENELHWVGVADFSKGEYNKGKDLYKGDIKIHPVFIDAETNSGFYNGFSNEVLWPLFHYFPSFVQYNPDDFKAYVKANEIIADHVVSIMNESDTLWIHDYHLMPMAAMIRERQPQIKIGFFLHIPFPSYELIRLLPKECREVLVKGLLGADLIGFHTYDYVQHFLTTVQMIEGVQHKHFSLFHNNREVRVGAFPISIDFKKFNDAYEEEAVKVERKKIFKLYNGKKIIFSVDRLDYTKGILYRLNGFAQFLEKHPEWKENIVFILVAVPSRDVIEKYVERKQMIELLISEINGKLGSAFWTPIVYSYGSVNFQELLGLYTSCDIALISPSRDGMNLVAKEFAASRKDQQGVLLLSDMTGTAKELTDALLFNPLDEEEIANKIQTALVMKPEEQERRMMHMQKQIEKHNVLKWGNDFINELESVYKKQRSPLSVKGHVNELLSRYQQAKKRLFLLDYDGTLSGFKSKPEDAKPEDRVLKLIKRLSADKNNTVAIVSGRDRVTLEEWWGDLPISLIAEHGTFVKKDVWEPTIKDLISWRKGVLKIMRTFAENSSGSFVEEKTYALCWHYRNANDESGFAQSRELISILSDYLISSDANIIDGNKVIEVKPVQMNKGAAVGQVFNLEEYDYVVSIGDDKTDEDMFEVVNQYQAITIKVGDANTIANYRTENVESVITFLDQLK